MNKNSVKNRNRGGRSRRGKKGKILERDFYVPREPNLSYAPPIAVSKAIRTNKPRFKYNSSGDIRVYNSEMYENVNGSVGFGCYGYKLQPGLFTWLGSIAVNYQTYDVVSFSIKYVPVCPTTTAGIVAIYVDHNVYDQAPPGMYSLSSNFGAVSGASYTPFECKLTSDNLMRHATGKFTRSTPPIYGEDYKLYDFGALWLAMQGQAATTMIGSVYIDYVIDFHTPQKRQVKDDSALDYSGTRAAPFGTQTHVWGDNLSVVSNTTVAVAFPGKYVLYALYNGTVVTDVLPTLTGTATATAVTSAQLANAAATQGMMSYIIDVLVAGATIIWDLAACCDTLSNIFLDISDIGSVKATALLAY